MRIELSLFRISQLSLTYEHLGPHGATLTLDVDGQELYFAFANSHAGRAAWAQLRQGLPRGADYRATIDEVDYDADHAERAALEWLGPSAGGGQGSKVPR